MQAVIGALFPRCQGYLAASDVGSSQVASAGKQLIGLIILSLLLAGIGVLVFISVQDLMRGALIETPGLCIWV